MMNYRISTFFLIFLIAAFPSSVFSVEPSWSDYEQLLKHHVTLGKKEGVSLTLVDYQAIKVGSLLPKVVQKIARFSPQDLEGRKEQIAFYSNVYNILAIKMVVDHWPLESIKDVGSLFSSVWKKPAGKIGGKVYSLDEIEHKILRSLGEARIHAAIVCASVSCPDLRDEPYVAAQLDRQLDEQMHRFLNNKAKGLRIENDEVRVSKIFKWFSEDFERQGGIDTFIRRYRSDLPKALSIKANLPYNWSINSTSN